MLKKREMERKREQGQKKEGRQKGKEIPKLYKRHPGIDEKIIVKPMEDSRCICLIQGADQWRTRQ